jgi:hypothetical protein
MNMVRLRQESRRARLSVFAHWQRQLPPRKKKHRAFESGARLALLAKKHCQRLEVGARCLGTALAGILLDSALVVAH